MIKNRSCRPCRVAVRRLWVRCRRSQTRRGRRQRRRWWTLVVERRRSSTSPVRASWTLQSRFRDTADPRRRAASRRRCHPCRSTDLVTLWCLPSRLCASELRTFADRWRSSRRPIRLRSSGWWGPAAVCPSVKEPLLSNDPGIRRTWIWLPGDLWNRGTRSP